MSSMFFGDWHWHVDSRKSMKIQIEMTKKKLFFDIHREEI